LDSEYVHRLFGLKPVTVMTDEELLAEEQARSAECARTWDRSELEHYRAVIAWEAVKDEQLARLCVGMTIRQRREARLMDYRTWRTTND
jgi:hypothetical protein